MDASNSGAATRRTQVPSVVQHPVGNHPDLSGVAPAARGPPRVLRAFDLPSVGTAGSAGAGGQHGKHRRSAAHVVNNSCPAAKPGVSQRLSSGQVAVSHADNAPSHEVVEVQSGKAADDSSPVSTTDVELFSEQDQTDAAKGDSSTEVPFQANTAENTDLLGTVAEIDLTGDHTMVADTQAADTDALLKKLVVNAETTADMDKITESDTDVGVEGAPAESRQNCDVQEFSMSGEALRTVVVQETTASAVTALVAQENYGQRVPTETSMAAEATHVQDLTIAKLAGSSAQGESASSQTKSAYQANFQGIAPGPSMPRQPDAEQFARGATLRDANLSRHSGPDPNPAGQDPVVQESERDSPRWRRALRRLSFRRVRGCLGISRHDG